MCQPKEKGGMGFRDLKGFNKALLESKVRGYRQILTLYFQGFSRQSTSRIASLLMPLLENIHHLLGGISCLPKL